MTKIFKEKDVNGKFLKNKILAVIGFGSQGRAHAMNLRDGGHRVIVGLYPKSGAVAAAEKCGFDVVSPAAAVKLADVALIALPDMEQPEIFGRDILPNLSKGKTLVFLHGLTVHSGLVKIPDGVNAVLVAPKGQGHTVRSLYLEGRGVPALIAVERGGRDAKATALAWAHGIGATRAGVIETTFKEETETDLFGEQAVLCGGLVSLVQSAFETLVKAGYKPEMAYFECCHELKFIVDSICQSGVSGMLSTVSDTAKYGGITRGQRVVGDRSKREMERVLKEIQSGKFAKEWAAEYAGGLKKYNKLLADGEKHPIEKVGQRLRSLMPWAAKQNAKGAKAAYSALFDAPNGRRK